MPFSEKCGIEKLKYNLNQATIMPQDNGHLGIDDLMALTKGLAPNRHEKELRYHLQHAAVIPTLLRHGRVELAKIYLERARGYRNFTTQPVAGIDGYFGILEKEIKGHEAARA